MKRLTMILTAGLLLLLPISISAQEINVKQSDQTNKIKADNTSGVGSKKVTKPVKETENLNDNEGLYHVVVMTKGHKKESLWVELKPGERKYITIRLDNGINKDVSILLNDKKQSLPVRFGPYDHLSQLTLQPISF
jgi:hypothetical protein